MKIQAPGFNQPLNPLNPLDPYNPYEPSEPIRPHPTPIRPFWIHLNQLNP